MPGKPGKLFYSAIKLVVLVLSISYLVYRIVTFILSDGDISGFDFNSIGKSYVLYTLLLMFVNWGLESIKWKILIKEIEKVTFIQAYLAVVSGVFVSVFSPNRAGDFLGRTIRLRKENRNEGAVLTIAGSLCQLFATLIFGLLGCLLYLSYIGDSSKENLIVLMSIVSIVLIALILLILYNFRKIKKFTGRIGFLKRYETYFDSVAKAGSRKINTVLLISSVRYFVFIIQYYLMLKAFGIEISFSHSMILVPLIFLAGSYIPTVTLAEFGVKGSLAIYFIGQSGDNVIPVIGVAFLIWLINICIPALAGIVPFMRSRLN